MILINGILIIIGGISLFYFIFCIIEFRSEKYTNIINSNNNIIEIFVNWLDNLPQIIKKKKKWYCYEYWRPNIPANGCKQQCEWCKIKQNES